MKGVETGDTTGIRIKRIAAGLAEPLGLKVVEGDIYVLQKQELTQLIDHDGDEVTDEYRAVCNSWGVTQDFHEFSYGLVFHQGHFYINLGLAMRLMSHETPHPDRSSTLKIAPDGSFKKINFGLRQDNGIGIGVDGELFITENQGRWVPSCKVIHVQPGVFHGCRIALKDSLPDIEMKPPAVWLPQDEIGNSPGQPVYVSEGTYTGQMLHGEVTHGGIKRVFPEKVNGEYQGCVFRFSQGLEAGINQMVRGPDGGLEIEFTKPLKAGRGENSTDYTVQQWQYEPISSYGGPKLDHTALPVKRIIVSPDRHKVNLIIPDRKEKHVVYIRLNDQLISKDNETLWSGETWYTLNAIPEANNR